MCCDVNNQVIVSKAYVADNLNNYESLIIYVYYVILLVWRRS